MVGLSVNSEKHCADITGSQRMHPNVYADPPTLICSHTGWYLWYLVSVVTSYKAGRSLIRYLIYVCEIDLFYVFKNVGSELVSCNIWFEGQTLKPFIFLSSSLSPSLPWSAEVCWPCDDLKINTLSGCLWLLLEFEFRLWFRFLELWEPLLPRHSECWHQCAPIAAVSLL